MAYETVHTSSGLTIVVDVAGGGNMEVVKLDIGADGVASGPVCTANPLPITAPSNLPVAVAGTVPVSIAAALSVDSHNPLEVATTAQVLRVEGRPPVEDRNVNIAWAASAPQNTAVNVDLSAPANGTRIGGGVSIIVQNPSTITALTCSVCTTWNNGSGTRYAQRTSFVVAANNGDGQEFLVDGPVLESGMRLIFTNQTALGVGQNFTGRVAANLF